MGAENVRGMSAEAVDHRAMPKLNVPLTMSTRQMVVEALERPQSFPQRELSAFAASIGITNVSRRQVRAASATVAILAADGTDALTVEVMDRKNNGAQLVFRWKTSTPSSDAQVQQAARDVAYALDYEGQCW